MNVLTRSRVSAMRLETKYLRLRTPVTLGSRFGDWQVCWLGGWTRLRLSYPVMVVHVPREHTEGPRARIHGSICPLDLDVVDVDLGVLTYNTSTTS